MSLARSCRPLTAALVLAGLITWPPGAGAPAGVTATKPGPSHGYSLDGRRRFHRYGDEPIGGLQPLRRRFLVNGPRGAALLDARTGAVLRRYGPLRVTPIFGDQAFSPTAAG